MKREHAPDRTEFLRLTRREAIRAAVLVAPGWFAAPVHAGLPGHPVDTPVTAPAGGFVPENDYPYFGFEPDRAAG